MEVEVRLDAFAGGDERSHGKAPFHVERNHGRRCGAVSHRHREANGAESIIVLLSDDGSAIDGALGIPMSSLQATHDHHREQAQEPEPAAPTYFADEGLTLHSVT